MIETLARYVAMPVIGVVLIVLAAVALGAFAAWLALPSRKKFRRLECELAELTQTHSRYKGDVLEHFQKSSELFAQLTESYKAVYQHLAHGAQALCSDAAALEGSVFASSRLLVEPVLDIGATAPDASSVATSVGADAAQRSLFSGSAGAGDAAPATAASTSDAAVAAAPTPVDEAVAAEPRKQWRMDAPAVAATSRVQAPRHAPDTDSDADADDDEFGRFGAAGDGAHDEDASRDVLAARGF